MEPTETADPVVDSLPETSVECAENHEPLIDDELLVEEISIDGMCGVY